MRGKKKEPFASRVRCSKVRPSYDRKGKRSTADKRAVLGSLCVTKCLLFKPKAGRSAFRFRVTAKLAKTSVSSTGCRAIHVAHTLSQRESIACLKKVKDSHAAIYKAMCLFSNRGCFFAAAVLCEIAYNLQQQYLPRRLSTATRSCKDKACC